MKKKILSLVLMVMMIACIFSVPAFAAVTELAGGGFSSDGNNSSGGSSSSNGNSSSNGKVPSTGDNSNIGFWLFILVMAGILLVGVPTIRKMNK